MPRLGMDSGPGPINNAESLRAAMGRSEAADKGRLGGSLSSAEELRAKLRKPEEEPKRGLREKIANTLKEVKEGRAGSFAAGLIKASGESMKNPTFWYGFMTAGSVAAVRSLAMHYGGAETSEFFAVAVGGVLNAVKEGAMERFRGGDRKKIAGAVLTGALIGAISADIGYRSAGSDGWADAGAEMAKVAATGSLAAFSSFTRRLATEGRGAISGKTWKEMAVSGVLAGAFSGAADWWLGTGVEKTGPAEAAPSSLAEQQQAPPTRDPWAMPEVEINMPPMGGNPPEVAAIEPSVVPTSAPENVTVPVNPTATPSPEVTVVPPAAETLASVPTESVPTPSSTPEPTVEPSATPTKLPPTSTPVLPTATATEVPIVVTAEPTPQRAVGGAKPIWRFILDWWNGDRTGEAQVNPTPTPEAPAANPGAGSLDPAESQASAGVPSETAEQAAIREAAERAAKAKEVILNPSIIPSELVLSGEINPDIQAVMQNEVDSAPAGFLSTQEEVTLENLTYHYGEMMDTTEPLTLNQPDEYYARVENNPDVSSLKGLTEGRIGELVLRDPDFQAQRDSIIDDLIKDPKVEEGVKNALLRIKEGKEDLSIDQKEFTVGNGAHQAIFDKFKEANPDKYKQLFDVGYLVSKTATPGAAFLADKPDLFRHGEQLYVPKVELLKKVYKL